MSSILSINTSFVSQIFDSVPHKQSSLPSFTQLIDAYFHHIYITGLAYFDSRGSLTSSTSLQLDDQQRLLVTALHCDLDAHSHTIAHVNIIDANLTNIQRLQVVRTVVVGGVEVVVVFVMS